MKQFTIKYIGQQSGLDFSPQSDTIIFKFKVLFEGKEFDINIKVAGIDFSTGRENENEIIKFGYQKIKDMIGKPELKSATYLKVGDELEEDNSK